MNDAKAEMYGSYLALFYFACTMFLLQLYFESKLGPAVWGLVAWQIYRRNKATLIYIPGQLIGDAFDMLLSTTKAKGLP